MKTLFRIFLCAFASFYSCKPEELPQDKILENPIELPTEPVGDIGNEGDVWDDKKND